MLGFPHFRRLLITFYGLRSLTFFTAGGRGDPKLFSSNSWNYVFIYHQCKIMIAYFSLLEKIICREFSSSPNNNFLKPGICRGDLDCIRWYALYMPVYKSNWRSCSGRSLCQRQAVGSTVTGQMKQIPFTGQVSDAAITAVNCNHIQSTKEVTINGVYSFYFLLCMILYIWLFFFP